MSKTAEGMQEEILRKPFVHFDLPSLDEFASENAKHDHCIVALYHIYRDLYIKRDLINVKVVDASDWGKNEYFLEGECRHAPYRTRLLMPFHLDAEIDLHWVNDFASRYLDKSKELYMALHTAESVIYQSIHQELPGLD